MNSYCIMHLERHVATLRSDGSCTVYYPRFMPFNLYLEKAEAENLDTRLNNLNNFYYWCASRTLTLDRKYAKEILNTLGLRQAVTDKDRANIAISYRCLSLTDVYWIRKLGESVRYADINLYQHSLSNAFVDVALCGKHLTAQNAQMLKKEDSAGDISTSGVAPKAWVRRNGEFWLYKDGESSEVKAELLASKIARCFKVPQIEYEAVEYNGETASSSKLYTSLCKSIVSAEYIEIYAANHGTSLAEIVRKKDPYGFYMMNIIDYLVGNTDRHWGNWGFSVDNSTNSLLELHPLMDFNRAFTGYDSPEGTVCQTEPGRISQRLAAENAVKKIGLNQISEVEPEWFDDDTVRNMFFTRLEILKSAEKNE